MSNYQLMNLHCWNESILTGGPEWKATPPETNWPLDAQPAGSRPEEN
jgi:hypothetical protein